MENKKMKKPAKMTGQQVADMAKKYEDKIAELKVQLQEKEQYSKESDELVKRYHSECVKYNSKRAELQTRIKELEK